MIEYISEDQVYKEVQEFKDFKPTLYANRNAPLEYLSDREFEILVYHLYKSKISKRTLNFDEILLMKGTKDLGRDCILIRDGRNYGVIQCKRYSEPVCKPSFVREIIKFLIHSINDKNLIHDSSDFTYYFIALKGINDPAIELYQDFNNKIKEEEKIEDWIVEVLDQNKSFKKNKLQLIKEPLLNLLEKVKIELVTGHDLTLDLKLEDEIRSTFFEVEKVINEDVFKNILKDFNVKGLNDEDVKRVVDRIEDIPSDQRMIMGMISFFGFHEDFLKRIVKNQKFKDLIEIIADFKAGINKEQIDFLKEKVEFYHSIYFAKSSAISAFTKQAIVPYLFSKCIAMYMDNEMGSIFNQVVGKSLSYPEEADLDKLKTKLVEGGAKIIRGDYSEVEGDEQLLSLKKELFNFIYKGFTTKKQLRETIDKEISEIKPTLDKIEKDLMDYIPSKTTIVVENLNFLDDKKMIERMIEESQRFDNE